MSVNVSQSPLVLRISPLISLTLGLLYLVLLLPLPFLAKVTAAPIAPGWLLLAIAAGGILILATLTEEVNLDQQGIRVIYPIWLPAWFRRGWSLDWSEVRELRARSTGQRGLVYYLISHQEQAYLLPTRVAGFARMVKEIETRTGIDTGMVRPLAQPWMYGTLLLFSLGMGLVDSWIIWTAVTLG